MSNYILLMQFFNDTQTPKEDSVRLAMMSEIGSGLSLIGCVMALSLLCFLPVKTDGLFILGNMCLVMMAAQLSFIGAENASYPYPMMCKVITMIIHYFFLCLIFGSLAYGMHLWSKCGPGPLQTYRKKGLYVIVIWVVPAIVVVMTYFIRGDSYGEGPWCWLPVSSHTRLAFLVPLLIILLLNVALYAVIIVSRVRYDVKKGQSIRMICKHIVTSSVSMMPSLNLQWFLGFSVTFDTALWLQYLYVAVCSGQGMLLLFCSILTNGQIKKSLCTKIHEADDSFHSSDSILSRTTGQTGNRESG